MRNFKGEWHLSPAGGVRNGEAVSLTTRARVAGGGFRLGSFGWGYAAL
ncbi:MAG: hypothetical protein R6V12_10580 [Candidatus Hydrogenedentota bacterium]